MNPPSIQTVLTNLISLTNERDVYELELLLAQSIYDLVQPMNHNADQSVVVYRAVNISKLEFNSVVITTKSDTDLPENKAVAASLEHSPAGDESSHKNSALSDDLKASLAECFESGKPLTIKGEDESELNFYPLKNATNRTVAVIAIKANINDLQLKQTIDMLLQIHQNFAGLIVDNEHDTLTGLLNRKTFEAKVDKIIQKMLSSTKRQDDQKNTKHYLALFDVDHFKKINDEYGHLVGDDVLRELSQLMKDTFRDKDTLFRYGGEEFVGVFECAKPQNIIQLLDRFRAKVSQFNFTGVGKVTISIGYTEVFSYDNSAQVVSRADQALYYAKQNGRNTTQQFEVLIANGLISEISEEVSLAL